MEQFIDDVLLMFKNCATFNYVSSKAQRRKEPLTPAFCPSALQPDSEVAQAGQSLETFFLEQLMEVFHDRTFANATLETMNRARLRWRHRKKDGHRRKRCSFRGHKYYLM